MTDAPKKPLKRITHHHTTADDFIRFLDAKAGDDDPCSVCGNDSWAVMCEDGEKDSTFRLGTIVRNAEKPFYLSTFAYYCESCGYVRQHLSRIVHDWVKNNPVSQSVGPTALEIEADMDDKTEDV